MGSITNDDYDRAEDRFFNPLFSKSSGLVLLSLCVFQVPSWWRHDWDAALHKLFSLIYITDT